MRSLSEVLELRNLFLGFKSLLIQDNKFLIGNALLLLARCSFFENDNFANFIRLCFYLDQQYLSCNS